MGNGRGSTLGVVLVVGRPGAMPLHEVDEPPAVRAVAAVTMGAAAADGRTSIARIYEYARKYCHS